MKKNISSRARQAILRSLDSAVSSLVALISREYAQLVQRITMLSVDIEDEKSAIKLLQEIVGLWVTMRGFTIAGCWLENYKRATKTTSQKGLSKELKRT